MNKVSSDLMRVKIKRFIQINVMRASLVLLSTVIGLGSGCAHLIVPHAEQIKAAAETGDDNRQAGSAHVNYSPMPMHVTFGRRFLGAQLSQNQVREIEQMLAWTPGLSSYHVEQILNGLENSGELRVMLKCETVILANVNGKWTIRSIIMMGHKGL